MFHSVSHQLSYKKAAEIVRRGGYKNPTRLQKSAFSAAFRGRDFAADYNPKEGKTLSILVPSLMNKGTLIATDTEQETQKIKNTLHKLPSSSNGSTSSVFLNGSGNIQSEIHLLARNPAIIVGTTTRIIDHIRRNNIELNTLDNLIIDITKTGSRDLFDKDVLFISTKLSRKVRRSVFLPDYNSLDTLGDILHRPVLSLKTTRKSTDYKQESRGNMDEKQVNEKIQQIVSVIKETEDPIVLKEYKKLIKKAVPFHLRGYFYGFLLKSICGDKTTISRKPQQPRKDIPVGNMKTLFINIGKNRRVYPKDLFRLFQKSLDIPGEMIGQIKVLGNYSFIDIASPQADSAVDKMDGMMFRGKKITVNFARKKDTNVPALTD